MKAVIFDLDQTILDRQSSLRKYVKWQASGMLRSEINDPDAFVSRFFELDENGRVWKDKVYEILIKEFSISGWSTRELLSVYELCFCAFITPMPGVEPAIRKLNNDGYALGLISNGMSPFQERNFRALEVAPLFDSVIISQAVGMRKPEAGIFELGCKQLNVHPTQAIFVGDNPEADIRGAIGAGMKTIFIPSKQHPDCDFANATCEDIKSLPLLIENLHN